MTSSDNHRFIGSSPSETRTVGMTPGGGQTKLPPARTYRSDDRIASTGCQSQRATTLSGDFCTASSRYGDSLTTVAAASCWGGSLALDGGDVIVKPPGLSMPGTKTSSHWPGRN